MAKSSTEALKAACSDKSSFNVGKWIFNLQAIGWTDYLSYLESASSTGGLIGKLVKVSLVSIDKGGEQAKQCVKYINGEPRILVTDDEINALDRECSTKLYNEVGKLYTLSRSAEKN